jgi:ATP synthase protein I
VPAHLIAIDTVARAGATGRWVDSMDDELAVEPLSREQAQALRQRMAFVSPWRVVVAQGVAGLLCAALAWLVWRDSGIAWSSLYGTAAVVLPGVLLARGLTRGARSALGSAAGFVFWEMLKIGVAVAMLLIAARVVPDLSWPALLITMGVCMKVNWLALLWRSR